MTKWLIGENQHGVERPLGLVVVLRVGRLLVVAAALLLGLAGVLGEEQVCQIAVRAF